MADRSIFARLGQVLCGVALVSSAPAYAAEVWDCTYTSMPYGHSISGRIEIQIDGKALYWKVSVGDVLEHVGAGSSRYEVLENNDVAIVAAKSVVVNFPSPLGLIGAGIVTINKANGELHYGSVFAPPVDDQRMTGVCKLNPATP